MDNTNLLTNYASRAEVRVWLRDYLREVAPLWQRREIATRGAGMAFRDRPAPPCVTITVTFVRTGRVLGMPVINLYFGVARVSCEAFHERVEDLDALLLRLADARDTADGINVWLRTHNVGETGIFDRRPDLIDQPLILPREARI